MLRPGGKIRFVALSVVLGVWLGGLIALFVFVLGLFQADRALAREAAPVLFDRFALMQAGLALAAIVLAVLPPRNRWTVGLCTLAVAGTIGVAVLTSRMNDLNRRGGDDVRAEFMRLHGYSNVVYLAVLACVLGALVLTLWRGTKSQTAA